jgi:membrane-bound lytic murein transglycosylase A
MTHDRVRRAVAVLFGVLSVFVAGCSSDTVLDEVKPAIDRALPPGAPALIRAEPADIPDWKKLWPADPGTLEALDQSLAYFAKPSSKKHFPYALVDGTVTHDRQVESLKTLRKILETSRTEREFEGWMNGAFDVYKSVGYDYDKGRLGGNVFFTAYYTPIFEGSRTADDVYRYPLYRRPAELAADDEGTPLGRRMPDGSIVPWPTRAEIDASGMFAGTELLWLKDPFEVYIVHVQGSARVRMQDGEIVHVGYHGKTERPIEAWGRSS